MKTDQPTPKFANARSAIYCSLRMPEEDALWAVFATVDGALRFAEREASFNGWPVVFHANGFEAEAREFVTARQALEWLCQTSIWGRLPTGKETA